MLFNKKHKIVITIKKQTFQNLQETYNFIEPQDRGTFDWPTWEKFYVAHP